MRENCLKESSSTTKKYKHVNLPSVAFLCDRTAVSDRTAVCISRAALKDIGVICKDASQVLDRNQIRHARSRMKRKIKITHSKTKEESPLSVFFDGRKDSTILQVKERNKSSNKEIIEDHVTILQEPGSIYIGHITPNSVSAQDMASEINSFLNSENINTTNLQAVGHD